jgi:hypothetical protein
MSEIKRTKKGKWARGSSGNPETQFKPGQSGNPGGGFQPGQSGSPKHRFQPGQSGNPGGLSSEQAKRIRRNGERAARIRARMLAAMERKIDKAGGGEDLGDIDADQLKEILSLLTPEAMRMLADSEARAFGAPKQPIEIEDATKRDEELISELIASGMSTAQIRAAGISVPAYFDEADDEDGGAVVH